jgi:hypothetical protein
LDLFPHHFARAGKFLVLRRRKLTGAGTHDGLQLPDTTVVHLTDSGGAQHVTYEEFRQEQAIAIVRDVDMNLYYDIMQRVRSALSEQKPYHVIEWNCERFVNWLIGEEPVSPQVNGWFFVGSAVGVLAFLARL